MCILSATGGSPNTSPLFQSIQINSSKIEIVFDLKHFHVSPGSLIKYKAKLPAAKNTKSQAGDFPRRDAESLKNRDMGRQRVSTVIIGFEIALRSDVALTNTVLLAAAIWKWR